MSKQMEEKNPADSVFFWCKGHVDSRLLSFYRYK